MIEVNEELIKEIYIPREMDGYKGDYGHTFVVAGSKGFTGAAYFAALAAVRTGSGLVTLGTHQDVMEELEIKLNEPMMISIEQISHVRQMLDRATSIAFGPGVGDNPRNYDILKKITVCGSSPLIIDADGLTMLAKDLKILEKRLCPTVLTPHYGEFSKLTGISIDELKKHKFEYAFDFARKHNVILVLKDHRTIITDGNEIYVNTTGNSAMANGGMGDVLCGMIASFAGQGYCTLRATLLAVYLHGLTGDILSENMYCVNPSHMLESLPYIMKKHICNKNSKN
ncbi:MAG: NAD(P)H-hydrate dehydratase [Cetobacterium sp.]